MKQKNPIWVKIVAVLVALGIAGGCGFGGWTVYQQYHGGAVEVYSVSELSTSWWGDETQTEGLVTTDRLQTEYLSDSQTIDKLMVKEGQAVKKGDILFTYDSTLSDIDLSRKKLELQQKEQALSDAKKELATIKTYRAGKPIPGSVTKPKKKKSSKTSKKTTKKVIPTYPNLVLDSGKGTQKSPFRYQWNPSFQYTDDFLNAAIRGEVEGYVTFYTTGTTEAEEEKPSDDTPTDSGDSSQSTDSGDSSQSDSGDESQPTDSGDSSQSTNSGDGSQSDSGDDSQPTDSDSDGQSDSGDSESEGEVTTLSFRTSAAMPTLLASGKTKSVDTEWTMQIQHASYGYRYVILSMTVNGQTCQLAEPNPKLDKMEYPSDNDGTGYDSGVIDDVPDTGIIYTSAEINEMLRNQNETIRNLDLEYRQLQVETEKLIREVGDSSVRAKLDGTVTMAVSPEDAEQGSPVVKVSGGGGYLVKGTISELDLQTVELGQQVSITDWMTGNSYYGSVTEISDYPTAGNGYWGSGNTNVSYYAFTVSVEEAASMEENSYVQMSYTPSQTTMNSQSIYLMKSFVRRENGQSYVYLDNNGTLEKVIVSTGRDLWGSYTEITSGNVPNDGRIAFPYGQRVRENAPTVEGDMSSLYGY